MKKFIAAALSFILVVATCAFTACTPEDESIGIVEGNYVETDAAGLSAALANVDADSADFASGFGFDCATKFAFTLEAPDTYTITADGNFGYKITGGLEGETLTLNGAGNGAASYSLKMGNTKTEGNYGLNLYNDSQFVYLDVAGAQTLKGKIDVKKIIEDAMQGGLPEIGGGEAGGESGLPETGLPETGLPETGPGTPDSEQPTLPEIIAQMEALGIKSYIDTNDGLKIKISVTKETVQKAMTELLVMIKATYPEEEVAMIEAMLALIDFTSVKMDFYFAFDAQGKFVQFGEDMEIAVTVQPEEDAVGAKPVTIKISSSSYLKTYAGTVALPDGLDEYVDLTDGITKPQIPA